jgi:hypothetical protein
MAKKETAKSKRPAFEVKAVQYVELCIPDSIPGYYGGRLDFYKTFKKDEAFDLAKAVEEAARQL